MATLRNDTVIRSADGQGTAAIVTASNIGSYGVATNSTYYVGTTQNIFNRASGAQTLTGVSIDGSSASCTGNSATATILQTARNINGTSFNGSAAITTANWGTARTLTIGSTGKSVDGSAAITWSLAEIGAAATNQTMFVGTTSVAINRASASQTLTGVSIDGTASNITAYTINQSVGTANTPSFAGVISSAVTGYAYLQVVDVNNFWITPGNVNWGLYFETAAGGLLGGTGDSNRLGFVGSGAARFYVDLNNGNGWFGGSLTANTDSRAPIFYDSNNTAYYCDPASTSAVNRIDILSGSAAINTTTPGTSAYQLNFTGQSTADYAQAITWGWSTSGAEAGIYVQSSGGYGTKMYIATTDSFVTGSKTAITIDHTGVVTTNRNYLQATGSLRAPIFYDSDNTAYYIDAASTSNLVGLTVANTITGSVSGNAGTATVLQTARNINGTSFNGSAAITTASWGTARTLTIGSTGKSVDGSAAVSWSLAELGAAATNQTMFIGTTSVAINRASASQTLTGVSIDGNAATATNGLTTSNYVGYSAFTGSVSSGGNITATSYIYTSTYLQTGGNLIYPSGYGATQRLEVSNAANNTWIDGITIAPGGIVTAPYEMRSPIFYDSNDTTYYIDPASTSRVVALWVRGSSETTGNIYIGGTSAGNRLNINYDQIWTSTGHLYLQYSGAGNIDMNTGGGHAFSRTSLRAPIFYDFDNTAYYVDPASTSVLNKLTIDGGNYANNYFQSFSDFTSGTLVTTDIPATAAEGESFVMNVIGKSYSSASPFNFTVQGYLYNSTIINYSGIKLDSTGLATIKIFENGGVLCFWWATVTYWNAFEVSVRGYNSARSNYNRVTNITNSTEPVGTKKVAVTLQSFLRADASATNSVDLRAPIFYDSNNTAYYLDPANSGTSLLVAGKVGIGTTSPGAPLEVSGTSGDSLPTFKVTSTTAPNSFNYAGTILNSSLGAGRNYVLFIGKASSTKNAAYIGYNHSGTDGSNTNFLTLGHYASDNLLNILGNGNVGIGTTSPANKLHVLTGTPTSVTTPLSTTAILIDSNGDQYLEFRTTSASSGYMQGIAFTDNGRNAFIGYKEYTGAAAGTYGEAIHLAYADYSASDSNNGLYIGSSTNPAIGVTTPHLFVKGNGNVGIGTTSPSQKLHVVGTGFASSDFRAPIFYDSDNTAYYIDAASASILNTIRLTGKLTNNGSVSDDDGFGVYWDSGESTAYAIYREAGSWTSPYPDLRIAFHTGIKLGANAGYNGIRFYNDYDMTTQVMSVNNSGDGLGTNNVYVNNSLQADSSLRAPIFYDSNDTAYYLDPRSASVLSGLKLNGIDNDAAGNTSDAILWINKPNNNDWGIRVSGNLEYLLKLEGATSHTYNIQGMANGSEFWRCGTDLLYHNSNIRAPIFYDSNNTAYYIDPASTSVMNQINLAGILRRTASAAGYLEGNYPTGVDGNSSSAIYTIGGGYQPTATGLGNMYGCGYTVGNGTANPGLGATGWGFYVASGGTSRIFLDSDVGYGIASNSWRAPIFYDSNNTAYYVDPNSTSNLVGLTVANTITGSITGNAGGSSASCTGNAASASYANEIIITNLGTATVSINNGRTAIYRNENGLGAALAYSPVLHAGAGDTMWQVQGTYGSSGNGTFYFRQGYQGVFGNWLTMLSSANYNSYSPTLTGTGASGSWGISVTGSSASCTGNSATTTLATKATRANGNFYIDDNYGNTVVGAYNAARLQGVFAMGDSYKLTADGTGVGTLYGLAWSHPNFGGVAANLADHGLLILQNGVFKGAWGGGSLRTPGDVRGTLFYDWDNTGYYCDPASTSNLNAITAAGSVTAANYYTGGWFRNNASGNGLYNEATGQHFYSDNASYWNVASSSSSQGIRLRTGGHAGTVRGYFYADTNNDVGFLNQDGNWRLRVVGGDYSLADGSSMRAQIFYDSNDTGYYTDPAGTTILNIVRANSYVQKSASQSLSGTVGCTIDVNAAGIHVLTLAASTTISSFTYNNRTSNPSVNTIMLVIKYGGTASITWTNVLWANGTTPSLTSASGYADVYMLTSYQGGAATPSWIGTVVAQALVSTSL